MRIGLTGSMAAGKSTVSAILAELGFYIVDADKTAHAALGFPGVISDIKMVFGESVLDENGAVNRRALAGLAFLSKENTDALNAIVHPRVFEAMLNEAGEAEARGKAHIVFDVPLLFETGFERHCDRVLCVVADDETRYLRIMLRDGLSREEAAARLARQMDQDEKAARSNAVIINNGTGAELEKALLEALGHIGISPEAEAESSANEAELESYLPDCMDE
ncbi:MAG: dephospho-CoA kinase [Clostridia bacterium]|nr:dephospho-CoA kinase [Clostridia bacterium]